MTVSTAQSESIDFSTLNGADVSDADGQNFFWNFGAQSGMVNVRATWSDVVPVEGAMRTPVRGLADFADPFTGAVTFTVDMLVEVAFSATFASLTRDGLSGGRFEQVRLSSPEAVQFEPAQCGSDPGAERGDTRGLCACGPGHGQASTSTVPLKQAFHRGWLLRRLFDVEGVRV